MAAMTQQEIDNLKTGDLFYWSDPSSERDFEWGIVTGASQDTVKFIYPLRLGNEHEKEKRPYCVLNLVGFRLAKTEGAQK